MHLFQPLASYPVTSTLRRHGRRSASLLPSVFRAVVTVVAVVITACLLPSSALGQASHTSHFDGLDVTLSLSSTTLSVGDPLTLTVRLENTSDAARVKVTANYQLPPGNNLTVQVQPAGELEYRYQGPLASGTYSSIPMEVEKGKPESVDVMLYYDPSQPSGLLFPAPGKYSLAAGFKFLLRGNPAPLDAFLPATEIQVTAPGAKTEEILKKLDNPEYFRALHVGVAGTTDTLNALSAVAEKDSLTEIGALALKAVGTSFAHSASAEDRQKGAELLKRFLAEGIVKRGNDTVIWTIAAAYHRNEQYDLAREWIFYLVRTMPASPRIQAEDPLVYYYYLAPRAFAASVPWYLLQKPWEVPGKKPPADLKPRIADEQ